MSFSFIEFEDFDAQELGDYLSRCLGNTMLEGTIKKSNVSGKDILQCTAKTLEMKGLAAGVAKDVMAEVKKFQGLKRKKKINKIREKEFALFFALP